MKELALATCLAAAIACGGSAVAQDYYYGGGTYANPGNYSGGYNGYQGNYGPGYQGGYGYRRDYYAEFYQRYLVFLRECRQHLAFHRELRDLREDVPYGYDDPYDRRDQHQALRATHDLWHRDHPYATQCPSYGAYYNWARSRGGYGMGGYGASDYGWGGYRNDYWTR